MKNRYLTHISWPYSTENCQISMIFFIYFHMVLFQIPSIYSFGWRKTQNTRKNRKIREKLAKIGAEMTKIDFSDNFRHIIGPKF